MKESDNSYFKAEEKAQRIGSLRLQVSHAVSELGILKQNASKNNDGIQESSSSIFAGRGTSGTHVSQRTSRMLT